MVDPFAQGPQHRLGRVEIHVCHRKRQYVLVISIPLLAGGTAPVNDLVKVVAHEVALSPDVGVM